MELNTINSQSTWGKEVDNLNKNFQKVDDEMTKLQNATYKNKGYFSTVEKLKEAFPNATVGSKAYVGTSYPYAIWVWIDGVWTDSGKTGGEESLNLNEYIKEEDAINQFSNKAETDEKITELGSEIEHLFRLCNTEEIIKDELKNANQWLLYRTPVSANIPLYFHFISEGVSSIQGATAAGDSYQNVEYFVGGTNYFTVDGELWLKFTPTKDADGIRLFVKDSPCRCIQYNPVPVKEGLKEVEGLREDLSYRSDYAHAEIINGWSYPVIDIEAGEKYIVKVSNAEIGKTLNIYTVMSPNLSTPIERVQEKSMQSESVEIEFNPTANADRLRVYSTSTNTILLDVQVEKKGLSELKDEIDENRKNIDENRKNIESLEPLKYRYNGGGEVSNGWAYSVVGVKAAKKYILRVSGAEVGKTFNAYTVDKDSLSTNIDKIVEITTKSSTFESEFVATYDANRLKIYNGGTLATVELLEENERVSIETSQLVHSNKLNILSIEKVILPYKGKKILSLGDSYTWMNYYGKYLSESTGCEQRGRGQNGAPIRHFANDTYTGADGSSVSESFDKALLDQYDIITIMGGTNNYGQGQAIGSINDAAGDNTLFGDLKTLLNKIVSINPYMKIFFCTQPYRCPNPSFHNGLGGHTPNHSGVTLEDVANAIVEFSAYYGYPCYDFYHESGWNEYTNKVTNEGTEYPYRPFDDNKYTVDGLHPRNGEGNGAYQLGKGFGEFINRHLLL